MQKAGNIEADESTELPTAAETEDLSNGEVFETLQTGDKVLWDGKKQPLTVTAGYSKDDDKEFAAPVMIEGPRGGEKMLNQSMKDNDSISVDTFSLSNNGEWINNLRVVERA